MAFKMNTSIGKIHAKTQGTKPHAKAIATAQAPKPATGNVGMPTSPFHVETMGPISEVEDKRQKQSAKNTANRKSGKKVSYDSAYADADMKKYGGKDGKAKFIKDAKAYNANKNKSKNSGSESQSTNTPGKGENDINAIGETIKNRTAKVEGLNSKYKKNPETPKSEDKPVTVTTKPETPKKETRLDRRLAKTQKKGKNIADGKGVKTAKEQRKALRLKKRETRLKKRIENKK